MFDRITITPSRTEERLVPYEKTVTHNYAATTEQAKYLDELRTQARNDFIKALVVEPQLSGRAMGRFLVALFRDEIASQIIIDLRDESRKPIARFTVGDYELSRTENLPQCVFDEITRQLAANITMQALPVLHQNVLK